MSENIELLHKLKQTDLLQYKNLNALLSICQYVLPEDEKLAVNTAQMVKSVALAQSLTAMNFYELYIRTLHFLAPHDFDSYMLYIEKNRDASKRYWMPRRKVLLSTAQDMQKLADDELDLLTISMPPGAGKAQPLHSKVLTPNGFVTMGSLNVGDKIISGTGNVSHIIGVYPQGVKDTYKVTFDDGSYTECCKEHLWTVQARDDRRRARHGGKEKYRTVQLQDIMKNIKVECGKRLNYSVDYVKPIEFRLSTLPLDPYVLGVLLGDGSLTSGNLSFTTVDGEMVQMVADRLPKTDTLSWRGRMAYRICKKDVAVRDCRGHMVKSETQKALIELGLLNHNSEQKFIPKQYLFASINDRWELLRGLLDTDGCALGNSIEYCTISNGLSEGIIELVHSLGGYASVTTKTGSYRKNGEVVNCSLVYRITIQFTSGSESPFGLSRKSENYNPKREVIKRFVSSVEYIGQQECQCIMIDDPSHLYITDDYIITHNTTLGIFFLSWVMGKFPDQPNLASAHADKLTRSFYDGVMQIITDPEYCWSEIFPGVRFDSQNAKDETINLGKAKRFKTLTCRSIDGSLTGATRCEKILYADDLCSGIEEAMSKERLDKLWEKYTNDLKSRKKLGCKEIHIATRWSVHDVIGRLEQQYGGDPRCKFIVLPALDDNEESNFNYDYGVGFDSKYFHDMRNSLDDVSFRCLFMNQPIEREGLLYHESELRRYFELPTDEPDAVLGVCDTKDTGTDFEFLPVMYQYGDDYYLEDCICDNANTGILDERCANLLVKHKVKACRFESNNAGGRTADEVLRLCKGLGWQPHITKKFTTTNKITKIIVNADWVKKHVLFKDKTLIKPNTDYWRMINFMQTYTQMGKNKNDDVPDGLAQFALFVQSLTAGVVKVFKRPF